jgi:hypothetical protein
MAQHPASQQCNGSMGVCIASKTKQLGVHSTQDPWDLLCTWHCMEPQGPCLLPQYLGNLATALVAKQHTESEAY